MGARKTAIFLFQTENTLSEQVWSKNQNCQLKLKFGTNTNLNMQNSMVIFTFAVLDRKHPFWANLIQKIKIVSFEYAEFHGGLNFFCFRPEIPFLGKFGPKNQNFHFILKFDT